MVRRKSGEKQTTMEGRGGREGLPTKVCACCGRVFSWRKKWERDWERVKYCSKRCAAKGESG